MKTMSPHTESKKTELDDLAFETLLNILMSLPDLVALDSLIRASPRAFRIFNKHAHEIMENILSSGYTHRHICVIIRTVVLIRSSKLPIQSLAEFKEKVTDEAMLNRYSSFPDRFVPGHISKDTNLVVLRSILTTARLVESMAIDCLRSYLYRFRDLKPQHPINYNYHYNSPNSLGKPYVSIWEGRPDGGYSEVHDVGPPSWLEKQRIIRAFWRIELIHTVRKAAAHSLLSWPEEDIKKLNNAHPIDFFYSGMRYLRSTPDNPHQEFHELRIVLDCTQELRKDDNSNLSAGCGIWPASRPQEVQRDWPPPPAPLRTKDWKKLISATWCIHFYTRRMPRERDDYGRGHRTMTKIPFRPFGRLGFPFWDRDRMAAYGLLQPLVQKPGVKTLPSRGSFFEYAWESLLTAEQMAEIDEKCKATFERQNGAWVASESSAMGPKIRKDDQPHRNTGIQKLLLCFQRFRVAVPPKQ